jgi:hypothetical protein
LRGEYGEAPGDEDEAGPAGRGQAFAHDHHRQDGGDGGFEQRQRRGRAGGAAINAVGTVRSLIHMLAPDSGAQSIASMDTEVTGGGNIVSLLAQWGGAQLLESGVIWIALWRYRGLVPLMLGVVTAEQLLRVAIGTSKPLTTEHKPPGALSRVLLPAAAVTLAISLTEPQEFPRGH